MAGNPKLTFERLLDWVEGRLSAPEAQQIGQQVTNSTEALQSQVKWLAAFMRLSHHLVLAAPPPTVRATLERRFADFAQSRRLPTALQRLVAVLSFDSSHPSPLAAWRAGASEPIRQYVFTTDWADVALNIQPRLSGERLDLVGQLLSNAEPLGANTVAVQLLHQEREVAITVADELGEFLFEALAPGHYGLILSTDRVEIELPVFALTSN